jgi:hypothetical protein
MARGPGISEQSAQRFDDALRAVSLILEPLLKQAGLSVEEIESADLPTLELMLERVNDAVAHPEQFGEYGLQFNAQAGVIITKSQADQHFRVGALPILLERKSLILRRIALLRPVEEFEGLEEDLKRRVEDPALLEDLLKIFERRSSKAKQQTEEVLGEERQTTLDIDEAVKHREAVWKMRSQAYASFLSREPVAILIGAMLLLALGGALIVGMFTKVEPSQVITSGFLVILGYFFGQSSSDRGQGNR